MTGAGRARVGRREAPLPSGAEKARAVREMFDRIARRYDLLNRLMTFGMDVGWRRRTVRELRLPGRALVLDLACGTGDLCRELRASGYRPVGVDFAHRMLLAARTDAPLVEADVLRLPFRDASADGATCGFALRNVADLGAFFAEVARVVRRGGRVALLEAAEPAHPVLRLGHGLYLRRVVPLLGGLLSDRDAYRYLPASMAYLPPPQDLVAMLRGAGFPDAVRLPLSGGIAQLLVGTRA
ncbi:MAG TPA: ubiquinone/menaquinone biosynthesis methyltransferase [Actinomycetota bacterium]|nr:ubiquinone/menaquinone biosynthesis methyltransferase [Actinomycetota bacterium]